MAALYLAQPFRGRLELLAAARLDDDWDPPEFRTLPGNQTWALLHANHLAQGIHTEYYSALFVRPSPGKEPTVSLVDTASFSEIVSEQDCKTRDITARKHIFVNTGSGFRELNESEIERGKVGK